jgi:drug/metabolite transporter (DMT)-like permease
MRRPSVVELMLLATVLLWAFNFTVTKYALEHGFHPLAYSAFRYGAGAVLFSTFTYRREGTLRVRRRDIGLLLFAAGVGIWANQVFYVYSLTFTTATTVALVLGATPIFAALIAFAVGLERLDSRFWISAVISFFGVALIAVGSGGGSGVSTQVKGVLLSVATAASWAAYSVAVAPLMRRYSPYRISAIVLCVGFVPLLATAAHQLATQPTDLGWLPWLCVVYGILGPLVLTNILWFTAVHRVGPSRATLFANLQPFFAALFALLILDEKLGRLQLAGGALIVAGILLARRRSAPPVTEPRPDLSAGRTPDGAGSSRPASRRSRLPSK